MATWERANRTVNAACVPAAAAATRSVNVIASTRAASTLRSPSRASARAASVNSPNRANIPDSSATIDSAGHAVPTLPPARARSATVRIIGETLAQPTDNSGLALKRQVHQFAMVNADPR
jgi:hypothetical protein